MPVRIHNIVISKWVTCHFGVNYPFKRVPNCYAMLSYCWIPLHASCADGCAASIFLSNATWQQTSVFMKMPNRACGMMHQPLTLLMSSLSISLQVIERHFYITRQAFLATCRCRKWVWLSCGAVWENSPDSQQRWDMDPDSSACCMCCRDTHHLSGPK